MKAVWITPSAPARAAAQAFQIFKRAAMHLGARGGERFRARVRAGKAEHLMARGDQFLDNGRADESRRTGNKDTHDESSSLFDDSLGGHFGAAISR